MTNKSETDNGWVVIGRFGRPHGIKGLVTVVSFTEPRDNIANFKDWHAFIAHEWQPIKLLDLGLNIKSLVVQVEGYHDREAAARLTNKDIAIKKAQLPALQEGEYYWYELIDMQVINLQKIVLGTVKEIMPTGSNDVIVVVGPKRHLIPYLPGQNVIDIDMNQRVITVDWDADF